MKSIELNNFKIGADKLTIFAGPCVIEDEKMVFETASELQKITRELDINFVFKASYDKANRSSLESYRGPGLKEGLRILENVKKEFNLPILTDVHLPQDVDKAAVVADIIQIPAFLCRQTDLLVAAGKSGRIVNIKKGQFLAPDQILPLIKKVEAQNNHKILITERGTTFGYNNLVVDMRAIQIIQDMGYPCVFDATHSVQLPGGHGTSSSGERRFAPLLAKSAIAAGARALFFEIHPDPLCAKCDGDNMIALKDAKELFKKCKQVFEAVN